MSVRSRLANRAGPYLEPSEQIQAVFPAVSGPSPYSWSRRGSFTAFSSISHEVVVTERAILVIDLSKWTGRPVRLRLRRPRDFYFGRLSGLWGSFVLDNTKYWVQKRFHRDIAAADAALAEMTQ